MTKPKAPKLVTVAVVTTITIVLWVFFGVYRILTASSPPIVPEELLAPINPVLDQEALRNIEGRVFFEESEIPELSIDISTATIPIAEEEAPTATESAEGVEEEEPSATESANVSEIEEL